MKQADYNRYINRTKKLITIISKESDGNGFFMYTTKSGHQLFSKYDHELTTNKAYIMNINYDTKYDRWRLVEVY